MSSGRERVQMHNPVLGDASLGIRLTLFLTSVSLFRTAKLQNLELFLNSDRLMLSGLGA